jgi:hypothetical protein
MAAFFVCDPEIAAGTTPLWPVRGNATASTAMMREEMRQLVPQCAVDFGLTVFTEARIQRDKRVVKCSATGGGAQARVPLHAHAQREGLGALPAQEFTRNSFQGGVAADRRSRGNSRLRRSLHAGKANSFPDYEFQASEKIQLLKQAHTLGAFGVQ